MLEQAEKENAASPVAERPEQAPATAEQEEKKRRKIPEGYQLWSSGIPNVSARAMNEVEKTEINEYAARWLVLAILAVVAAGITVIFHQRLGWLTYVIVAICLLFARDWFFRMRALRKDLDAEYVNRFEGVGDPLLKTQRHRLSIWMRFMREGWSSPLVDSGYFVTAKWEEFELLPESEALWALEGVHLPLGTYSPSVVLARRGTSYDQDAAFRLPGKQDETERQVGRRRLTDERREQIADMMWVRSGKRYLTSAEKQELQHHCDEVRKLHRSLQIGLVLLSLLLVGVVIIAVWAFVEAHGGWFVFETTGMKVGLALLAVVCLLLLSSVGAVNFFFTRPTLEVLKFVERDMEKGTVEFVHFPKDPEKSKEDLQEVLAESGIDWTLDGHPSPWRLVGYLDLELAQLRREGQRPDTAKKILAQLVETISGDAQEVGAGYLSFRPQGEVVKVHYNGRHLLGEELLPPFISGVLRKIAGDVHRGARVQAGIEVGTLKRELFDRVVEQLGAILETKPVRSADGVEIPLPRTEEPVTKDKWAFYSSQPTKKIRGLIEVKEVQD
ncbi:MAG: TrbC/VirB2 family protein [Armatimonadetes bacterium]|nr:TrbC/VirB2 family protein [Armatimonadota bacterium]